MGWAVLVLSLYLGLLLERPGKAAEQATEQSSVISELWVQGLSLVVLGLDLGKYFLLECARPTEVMWKAVLGLLISTWKIHPHRSIC